jgi:enoyl-CoA hydratase/carnithine racemase
VSGTTPLLGFPAKHVALIELNRPKAANRIQPDDLAALRRHLEACEANEEIRALVLAANGPYFSAGFDLRALVAGLHADAGESEGESAFAAIADRLEQTRLIVVAAIQGPVLGGATDLALACDLRIGCDRSEMQMPAARFGLPLYAGALQRYVNRLGLNHAKRLVFTAEKIGAAEMLSIGFLSELVEPADVRARALALAVSVAQMPPKPLAAMKRVLNASARGVGTAPEQHEALRAALDRPGVAARIDSIRARRRPADRG